MTYLRIREEELKNKIAQDYFSSYDCTKIIGNIDFCVTIPQDKEHESLFETESVLWAEAKSGKSDIYKSLVQLILTIGKARTFDKQLPPAFLGAFDSQKIAFISYGEIYDVFYINDFNWNITPSNHGTREFIKLYETVKCIIEKESLVYLFDSDSVELKEFIKKNLIQGKSRASKTKIDKNNFMVIYNKWLITVMPSIAVNWEIANKNNVIDGDFYLADLLSQDNKSLIDNLYVVLEATKYSLNRHIDEYGAYTSSTVQFNDNQNAHSQFWNKYDRPPKEEYWEYIIRRRDLLVPQDIRERRGSYFTPKLWVELSQDYLKKTLGEDWQDEYYIWDCAAGTGNLLSGLTNKYNIWASTIDMQDVEVMKDRINNGATLLNDHVFQFDFLNDDFDRLPKSLRDIIENPRERQKLIIYINPPYAEVSSVGDKGKSGVNQSKTHDKYSDRLGAAGREIYIHFLVRVYVELNGCVLAEFSKLKVLQGSGFEEFRSFFQAKLKSCFLAPAYTFDNVSGSFPIGFKIWDTGETAKFERVISDVYDDTGNFIGLKTITAVSSDRVINRWISSYKKALTVNIGFLAGTNGNDFQQNRIVYILNRRDQMANPRGMWINQHNLIVVSVYYAVRKCAHGSWVNDRDQYVVPIEEWKEDDKFYTDCLAFTLFANGIRSSEGINYWIPFTEQDVNSRERFQSHFMVDFISGNLDNEEMEDMFSVSIIGATPLEFSEEADSLFNAGKQLWRYYHRQPFCNVNASLNDIREHFQGRNAKGKMNARSSDDTYTELISKLRSQLEILAYKIEPQIYKYVFLEG